MKSLLIAAALIAVAVAGPVQPGGAGPAPIVPDDQYEPIQVGPVVVDEYAPINVGPAIVDEYAPINVGPAIVDSYEPISVGPAVIAPEPIIVGPAIVDNEVNGAKAPLVQIILNINSLGQVEVPEAAPINPEPVIVVDESQTPIEVNPIDVIEVNPIDVIEVNPVPVEVIDVQPAEIGTPVLPSPVITLPEELN